MKIIVDEIPKNCEDCIFLTKEAYDGYGNVYVRKCALKRRKETCEEIFLLIGESK